MILIYHYHITKNHTADSELPVLPKNHEQTKKTTKHLCYVFVPYTPKHSYPSTLEKKKKKLPQLTLPTAKILGRPNEINMRFLSFSTII